eukprot:TRINITY_DN655_c0_g1_i1.p3 TRINITY_DN655_c0_g1~~TRINITY_DN655_c0_g1_i1.p3  ORF type:complete len:52 (-),score=1.39 TRINITY_DN655_c0_g1_i1:1-156(-)
MCIHTFLELNHALQRLINILTDCIKRHAEVKTSYKLQKKKKVTELDVGRYV